MTLERWQLIGLFFSHHLWRAEWWFRVLMTKDCLVFSLLVFSLVLRVLFACRTVRKRGVEDICNWACMGYMNRLMRSHHTQAHNYFLLVLTNAQALAQIPYKHESTTNSTRYSHTDSNRCAYISSLAVNSRSCYRKIESWSKLRCKLGSLFWGRILESEPSERYG